MNGNSTFSTHLPLDFSQHPDFRRAVEIAARRKCIAALRRGQIRVVVPNHHVSSTPTKYVPRMDLIDNPSSPNLVAVFELPGIKTEDIQLHVRDGNLVVHGERRSPHMKLGARNASAPNLASRGDSTAMNVDTPSVHDGSPIRELRYGTFHRSIQVPNGIKESEVAAGLKDGMLTVTWPRSSGDSANSTSSGPMSLRSGAVTPPTNVSAAATAQ